MSRGFTFTEEGHEYRNAEGVCVPSVTQILQGAGIVDYSGIDAAVLEHASQRGTAAHVACHYLDEGDLEWTTVHPEVEPYVRAWEKCKKETGLICTLIESQGVMSVEGMDYGYKLDRAITMFDFNYLGELKCTAKEEISWGPQTAAYELAARKLDGAVRNRIVIHLRPNGTYRLRPQRDPADYQVFKAALFLEHWKKARRT